jgi:hypothetical protein
MLMTRLSFRRRSTCKRGEGAPGSDLCVRLGGS